MNYAELLPEKLLPLQMEVVFPEESEEDDEGEIAYLYKVKEGVSERSNALKLF